MREYTCQLAKDNSGETCVVLVDSDGSVLEASHPLDYDEDVAYIDDVETVPDNAAWYNANPDKWHIVN